MPDTFEYNNRQQKYYSLGELTGSIRKVITKTYVSSYWVKTEIAKLNFYPYSGHCYPDLVEKQKGKIVAQIRATIWSGTYDLMSKKFRQVTGEELKEGMLVLFLVKVVYHEQHGLSLNILDIEPAFTLGEMARDKQLSVEKLKKEGVYDKNRQLLLPILPKNVAIISVETSKGYHDFLNILQHNRHGYSFELQLFPSLLQGDGAISSIVGQLKQIAQKAELFDVVVIIRGGGGDVGLSAYDNYKLAKMVATFPIPVITGIGHSTNETVTEMVAFANKITPTDVAYFLISRFEEFHAAVYDLAQRLDAGSRELLKGGSTLLENFSIDLRRQVKLLVEQNSGKINLHKEYLQNFTSRFLQNRHIALNGLVLNMQHNPLKVVSREKEQLILKSEMLTLLAKQSLKNSTATLAQVETKLNLLKPENILKRGYSITYFNGKVLKSGDKVVAGDKINTVLKKGKVYSRVTKKDTK